MTVTMAS